MCLSFNHILPIGNFLLIGSWNNQTNLTKTLHESFGETCNDWKYNLTEHPTKNSTKHSGFQTT